MIFKRRKTALDKLADAIPRAVLRDLGNTATVPSNLRVTRIELSRGYDGIGATITLSHRDKWEVRYEDATD